MPFAASRRELSERSGRTIYHSSASDISRRSAAVVSGGISCPSFLHPQSSVSENISIAAAKSAIDLFILRFLSDLTESLYTHYTTSVAVFQQYVKSNRRNTPF